MNLNEFFNELASDNSRNFKIAKLRENEHDRLLRRVIFHALDPFTQYYIRKIPKYKPCEDEVVMALDSAVDLLHDLSSRLVTGNAAIDHLKRVLELLSADDAKVIERIIGKDLKCGVSVSTANAVWSGLIPEYPCMLCSAHDEKLVNKIKFPAIVQKKEDGMRFNAIVQDGKCEFRSRNGKEIQLLGRLENEFICMANGMDVVFDGELLVASDNGVLDRQTGNGILNKANKGTISDAEADKVIAHIWDMIPYAYFIDGEYNKPYVDRLNNLAKIIFPEKIELVETHIVEDMNSVQNIFNDYLSNGFEGIILKDGQSIWENKRSKGQIKFKGEEECDLRIVDVEEGTGKYTGMLGAIVCESNDSILRVSVGSGFSDAQRTEYKRDDLLGKIVAVKYNMRIKNKQGEESLFLPVFIEVREDKNQADSIEQIK